MSGPPVVDYRATSLRPAWDALPEELKQALTVALGTEVVEAAPSVTSGFTGGFAAPVRLADGRRVFVKASDSTLHSYGAYQREAEIVPQLPAAAQAPAIITTARTDDWFALVSEWVDARMPGAPWTAADFDVVTARCEAMADALAPNPIAGLGTFLQDLEAGESALLVPEQILAGDRPIPRGLQEWVPRILPELADLMKAVPDALSGDAAAHTDLRPDNLLIDTTGTCWTVDWNWLALGPRWLDWVGLLPVAQHHGIDTSTAIRRSPLTADVPADELDCFIAVIAAYMLKNADNPPPIGTTRELREHQRFSAWTFLDWLAPRRGWTA